MVGLGLKAIVLTMPCFSSAKGLRFFSREKYYASSPRVVKVERTWKINAYIERCDAPNPGGSLTTRQPAETLVNVG